MGVNAFIKHDQFPKQGKYHGKKVKVCFHYDTQNSVNGVCVRDDIGDPGITAFRLDDGRFVLATECQWQPQK